MTTRKLFSLLALLIVFPLLLTSCGVETEEITLEKYNLTLTVPKLKVAPEYKNLKITDRDTKLSRYDFNIGKRINIVEIEQRIFPEDLNMLKNVLKEDDSFIEMIETKEFPNKAFGAIFKKKSSSGKEMKYYLFYFEKDGRYFRMEPVFNNDLKELDVQLAAYESLK